MSHTPAISVVIPARNAGRRLLSTISSLDDTRVVDVPCEVVVVDDASLVPVSRQLNRCRPRNLGLRILRSSQRLGVPRARNVGAAVATGRILFMTDSHVTLSPGWDRVLLDRCDRRRVVAATIGDDSSRFRGYGCSLVVPFMGTRWNTRVPRPRAATQIASAAGTGIHRELFWRTGGYDTGMILYGGAEPEFSLRTWLSGGRIECARDLEVSHRFKLKKERHSFLRGLRPYMVHNNLRFGLLYLRPQSSLQMLRHYAMKFPRQFRRACALIDGSDVWIRGRYLERELPRRFPWFIDRFGLKDQVGDRILG